MLSKNRDTGAETMLVRFAKHFSGHHVLSKLRTWEWIVLDGGMTLADGAKFWRFNYSHRPKGSGETVIAAAPNGCTLMLWMER